MKVKITIEGEAGTGKAAIANRIAQLFSKWNQVEVMFTQSENVLICHETRLPGGKVLTEKSLLKDKRFSNYDILIVTKQTKKLPK